MSVRVPVFRLLGGPDHFYTIGEVERDEAIAEFGYHYEGIAFYVYADAGGVPELPPITIRDQIAMSIAGNVVAAQITARATLRGTLPEVAAQDSAVHAQNVAEIAYQYADAMMLARTS